MDKVSSFNQIANLDRLAMNEAGLDILQMMEIAGNKFALHVKDYFKKLNGKNILVLSGTGNNGGDGLSAARYLANWGANIKVVLAKPDLKAAPKHHLKILKTMKIIIQINPNLLPQSDLIIDSLLGYNQQADPRPPFNNLINQANNSDTPIFSFDNPSGLNIENGLPTNPTIKAHATITLAVIKKGLVNPKAKKYVGKLYLVDLGIPNWVYKIVNLKYPFLN